MMELKLETGAMDWWLETTPRALQLGAARAMRETGKAVQRTAVQLFRQRGVGRSLTKGRGASNITDLGRIDNLRVKEGTLEQPITLKGLAAIQELGGHIHKHFIYPKRRKRLAFVVGGAQVVTTFVKHPGAEHPRMPFLEHAANQNMPKFRAELEKELAKAMDRKISGKR